MFIVFNVSAFCKQIYHCVDGLVIPGEFLVRIETYVFSENLVQKDYKLLGRQLVSYDVIIVTVIKILMKSEINVLYITGKIIQY